MTIHTGITGLEGITITPDRVPVIDLTRPPEYALHGSPPLVARHERALAPGVSHVFCDNPDCQEARRRPGHQQYVGALAAGTWAQCRRCGTWYDGPGVTGAPTGG
jgi:hypothetical protein